MRGGYLLFKEKSNPDFVLIATGSEVELCIKLKEAINNAKKSQNKSVNIVSIPCVELFLSQTHDYKMSILRGENVFLIEAGSKYGLSQIIIEVNKIGDAKKIQQVSINEFGLSGKSEELFEYFGFDAEKILDKKI
jgi:transketolase